MSSSLSSGLDHLGDCDCSVSFAAEDPLNSLIGYLSLSSLSSIVNAMGAKGGVIGPPLETVSPVLPMMDATQEFRRRTLMILSGTLVILSGVLSARRAGPSPPSQS